MTALSIDKGDLKAFIQTNTELLAPPLVPEIKLHLASEIFPLWHASEEELAKRDLPPPFWAFAWAGGQALARYILDHPEVVAGKRVLDFACGGGIQGIAAARAGAALVEVSDIDPFALAAVSLNATANDVRLNSLDGNLLEQEGGNWDVILAGDVCYEGPMAAKIESWLGCHAARGTEVLLGDPGRTYLPKSGLERIIAYAVKTTRELEDTDVRNAVVWRVEPTKPAI
jgi:predicted nicotinamide N-methyase